VAPLIDRPCRDKLQELVEDAVGRGARVEVPGGRTGARGYFDKPTVLSRITLDARP
jgi:succinate-semialdehyde dehydrogenase / glutarate-semialdehyde dehydrogenase